MNSTTTSTFSLSDHLCRYPLTSGTRLTNSILEQLCRQWGPRAIQQALYDLQANFQSDPILAGRYGIHNLQILIDQLEA